MFIEGTPVEYKGIPGVISFTSTQYVSVLVHKGEHRSQDVKIVIYNSDFSQIHILNEK